MSDEFSEPTYLRAARRAVAEDAHLHPAHTAPLLAELDRRGAAIERVRELHERYADGTCFECGKDYPCPTIEALDGEGRG
jgi:hypothetical protein